MVGGEIGNLVSHAPRRGGQSKGGVGWVIHGPPDTWMGGELSGFLLYCQYIELVIQISLFYYNPWYGTDIGIQFTCLLLVYLIIKYSFFHI